MNQNREINELVIDQKDFKERVVKSYNDGVADIDLEADVGVSRSLIPPGTGAYRDFSYIAPDIPEFIADNCTGCMECVTECPDTAILGKVVVKDKLNEFLGGYEDQKEKDFCGDQFSETAKFFKTPERKGQVGGLFGIFIDPSKCKGCGECVEVCGKREALKMIPKTDENVSLINTAWSFYRGLPETPKRYISQKALADIMLMEKGLLYVGGAGSCMGCGEATAIRMLLAATSFVYGENSMGMVASTGCNTVYGSTYPYNPYLIPWTNSLFENGPADAMGVRAQWNQRGWAGKKLWVLGGDGAMLDIGFQSLSRLLASGMDVNVMVLDTQVYSNTGGQASTSTFMGQESKMSYHGKAIKGKVERKKEIANLAMMHPEVYVAQTTPAHINHFYKAIMAANEYEGPAVVNVYTTCQPEHGVADNMSRYQAKLAADSRSFPIFVYDPRKGDRIKERMDLKGNPAVKSDWYTLPKTNEVVDFVYFARTEGRFAKHFDRDGNPSDAILRGNEERLLNWKILQELAGVI